MESSNNQQSEATAAAHSSSPTNTTTTESSQSGQEQQSPKKAVAASSSIATTNSSGNEGAATMATNSASGQGGDGGASSESSGGDKAETEDDELNSPETTGSCECVQCEVCMAENWWRMAAYHNTLLQQQGEEGGASGMMDQNVPSFDVSANAATGLDLIGSAATLILSQQQMLQHGGPDAIPAEDIMRADFSMPKLREFFECQKAMGVPNFPEDFDEFWLLVVKARLFNIFKYRGPEAYNRIVLKIRDIARQFRDQVEESERKEQEAEKAAKTESATGVIAEKTSPKKQKKTSS